MSNLLAENMLWRNIYCNVSKSSSDCIDMGYSFGIIPGGFALEVLLFISSICKAVTFFIPIICNQLKSIIFQVVHT